MEQMSLTLSSFSQRKTEFKEKLTGLDKNTWHLSTEPKSKAWPPECWKGFEVSCSENKMEQLSCALPPLRGAVAVLGRCPEQHRAIPRYTVCICIHLSSYLQSPLMPPVRDHATVNVWAGDRVPRDFLHWKSPRLWDGCHLENRVTAGDVSHPGREAQGGGAPDGGPSSSGPFPRPHREEEAAGLPCGRFPA